VIGLLSLPRSGVNVPALRMVDAVEGVLGIEWVEGRSVRYLLGGSEEEADNIQDEAAEAEEDQPIQEEDPLMAYGVSGGESHYLHRSKAR
jgi:TP53 regulating kinase-like protein